MHPVFKGTGLEKDTQKVEYVCTTELSVEADAVVVEIDVQVTAVNVQVPQSIMPVPVESAVQTVTVTGYNEIGLQMVDIEKDEVKPEFIQVGTPFITERVLVVVENEHDRPASKVYKNFEKIKINLLIFEHK